MNYVPDFCFAGKGYGLSVSEETGGEMSEDPGAGKGEVIMSSGHHYFIKKKKRIPATSSFPDQSRLGSPIQMPPYPNPDFSCSFPNFPLFVPF